MWHRAAAAQTVSKYRHGVLRAATRGLSLRSEHEGRALPSRNIPALTGIPASRIMGRHLIMTALCSLRSMRILPHRADIHQRECRLTAKPSERSRRGPSTCVTSDDPLEMTLGKTAVPQK